jgi:hypothetical protein
MSSNMNLSPLIKWAIDNGDANIVDRILAKSLKELVSLNSLLSKNDLINSDKFNVEENIFNIIKDNTEQLIGKKYV